MDHTSRSSPKWTVFRLYGVFSFLCATFAIVSSPGLEEDNAISNTSNTWGEHFLQRRKYASTISSKRLYPSSQMIHRIQQPKRIKTKNSQALLSRFTRWLSARVTVPPDTTSKPTTPPIINDNTSTTSEQKKEETRTTTGSSRAVAVLSWFDPCTLHFTVQCPRNLVDKVMSSNARLLLIVNWFLVCMVLLHSAIARLFLGPDTASSNWTGIGMNWMLFKLLLISSVVAHDYLDWLILLAWYTCLQLLRSLITLSANAITNARDMGQIPKSEVRKLLWTLLALDGIASVTCVGLLHEVGLCLSLVLTCDCVLLAVDMFIYLLLYKTLEFKFWHRENMAVLVQEQLMGYDRELEMEQLERNRLHQATFHDGGIVWLNILFDSIFVLHTLHIWTLHRLQFTWIDGILAMQLYSTLISINTTTMARNNLNLQRSLHQPPQQDPVIRDEPPWFRFITEGLIRWFPVHSFQLLRPPVTVWSLVSEMTGAEEQVVLQRLSNMFPQYDRNELLAVLRERGSAQAVFRAMFVGALAPTAQ